MEKEYLKSLKMNPISIDKIKNSQCYIISKVGSHASKTIGAVLQAKMYDIEKYKFCFWAHGMATGKDGYYKKNVDQFILNWEKNSNGNPMYVIMPIKNNPDSNNSDNNVEITYEAYENNKQNKENNNNKSVMTHCENSSIAESFPQMRLVTYEAGHDRTTAFCFKHLYYLEGGLDDTELTDNVMCMYANGTWNNFKPETTRADSNRCIKLKDNYLLKTLYNDDNGKKYTNCLIGELTASPIGDMEQKYCVRLFSRE